MYMNETTLTPLFRYIIWCIEKDGSDQFERACKEIRVFRGESREEWEVDRQIGKVSFDVVRYYVEKTVQLLEMHSLGKKEMYSFWKNEYDLIEKELCDKCILCKNCRKYFWYELGEVLFQEPNELKKSGTYFPVRRIPEKIEKHLAPSKKAADLYYNNNKRKRAKIGDGCIILKGMSSSTPSLMNSIYDTNQYSGGGFYLRYKGVGVVIDPGYHFLDNLHHYGLSVLDINVVIITHEHIDHNNDMRLLDDLYQSVYKYEQNEKKKIHWYLDRVSYEVARIYQKNETGFNEKTNVLHCISPHESEEIELGEDSGFYLKCFPTRHIENKEDKSFKNHTFGCQFKMQEREEKRCLVYTSDTRYFKELVNSIDMPDILIVNISGVYEDDFMLVKQKERHLGYYGCYHLVRDICNYFGEVPDLVLLSEFWNGENDIRYDVAEFLEKQLKQECNQDSLRIIPAEVGMRFQMQDGSVRCSQCGQFTKKFLIRRPNGYKEKIRTLCEACVY